MPYKKLSHTLEETSPVHIGLKNLEITPNSQVSKGGGYNSYIISVENHCGTHMDAPGHFLDEGKTISDYSQNELVFNNPLILDIPKEHNRIIKLEEIAEINLEGKDCLIFKTGFEKYRKDDSDTYLTSNPGIDPDLIYWLRKNHPDIRCIGVDCVSISSYKKPEQGKESHLNAFKENEELGEPLLLVEDMKLDGVSNISVEHIIVVPWQINGIDSAPCTVLAKTRDF
ncbi:MAG: cyclase family protein [Methanobacterium sp.]|uniref:cyclase family protein n=1 Tax=Methanobacterium sp. TaxID=2164 RepID=UPI003D655543|nr:cyclase family protein [Methanobacterium sp.]